MTTIKTNTEASDLLHFCPKYFVKTRPVEVGSTRECIKTRRVSTNTGGEVQEDTQRQDLLRWKVQENTSRDDC